ncbi:MULTISPECIES: hypothetical protein [Sphingobacterium]|uniref:hypothetical protein n=1 Tax=Sphingobacterium TaxID=28453 RepID=UPI0013DC34B8|nr:MULTISPECIES: hypothetical protein [unclassified Sphingobacterium]
MDKFKLMDEIGISLFLKLFPKTEEKIIIPDDQFSKYDLIVRGEEHDKYVELKCLKQVISQTLTNLITVSDFDYLTKEVPTGDKSLYCLFDDNVCVVYDLKAVHHLNLYTIEKRGNYKSEMNQNDYHTSDYVIIDYAECLKAGIVKCYVKSGSKQLADFKITEVLKKLKTGITEEFLDDILEKIKII